MKPQEFKEQLEKDGLPISDEQLNQFQKYLELLQE